MIARQTVDLMHPRVARLACFSVTGGFGIALVSEKTRVDQADVLAISVT